jgi:hypothetical protein
MNNTFYPPNDYRLYLEHHGIKGMRWGIRRWQDQNGRYNAAGRERYGIGDGREYAGVRTPTRQVRAPAVVRRAMPRPVVARPTVRPPHRVPVPEARQAIQNRVSSTANRARAIADKVSNTSLSDAKKYVETYAFGKNTVDTYLKTNVTLSRIQSNDTFENFAFYATYKRHDVNEYAGLFGKNLMNRADAAAKQAEKLAKKTGLDEDLQNAKELRDKADNMKIYQLKIGATKKLKIPSDENAGNVVGDLLKDADFRKNLSLSIDHSKEIMRRPTQQALFRDAQSILQKRGTLTNTEKQTLYKALNLSLTNHNDYEIAAQNKFYGELKKRGYGALVDINDKEYSSYHAHRPMIIFDTDSVKLQSSAQMNQKTIERLNKVYNAERILKDIPANVIGAPKKYGETTLNIARRTVESAYNEYLGKGR